MFEVLAFSEELEESVVAVQGKFSEELVDTAEAKDILNQLVASLTPRDI